MCTGTKEEQILLHKFFSTQRLSSSHTSHVHWDQGMHYPTSVTCLTYSLCQRTLSLALCPPLKKWRLDPPKKWRLDPQRQGLLTIRVSLLIICVSLPQYLPMAQHTLGAILLLHIRRLTITKHIIAHTHITAHVRHTHFTTNIRRLATSTYLAPYHYYAYYYTHANFCTH
jgi:hypothetical protein